ncbi:MAG: 4'-phosphopantetheinyl transferase superfamily protein [Lachnospiraceae bacterium]|nr:4'-phosphopantetheinyl transferase superfamily protein [Lachnospiraceae bacterium]
MEIYIGNTGDHTTEYLSGLVSEERRSSSMKYRFEADRKRALLAHALLNHAISVNYPEIPIPLNPIIDEHGKPHVYLTGHHLTGISPDTSSEIFFSLSHSGDHAICILDGKAVGADIEEIKDEKDKIADRFFAAEERQYITDATSFYSIWSLKESFMKAVGLGMQLAMDSFTVCDFNIGTGTCRFRPCSTSNGSNTKAFNMEALIDPQSGYYKISGRSIKELSGYSLAYAVLDTDTDELLKPVISYPSL